MRSFSHYCWLSLRDQHSRLLNARSPRAQNTLIGLTCISWTNTLNLCLSSTVLSRQREQRIRLLMVFLSKSSTTQKSLYRPTAHSPANAKNAWVRALQGRTVGFPLIPKLGDTNCVSADMTATYRP